MSLKQPAQNNGGSACRWFVLFLVLLCGILSVLFWQSFTHGKVLYSNDGSLGLANARANRLPGGFFGLWWDLNWLGNEGISASPSVSALIGTILGPFYFAKFYCGLAILTVGLGAWFCFRRLKLAPAACFIGGLAAALNSDFFSTSCWGVCATVIGIGMNYFALGFLADTTGRKRWVSVILGGLAVGLGVVEAFDIGALFSLFIATFVVYQALFLREGGGMSARFGTGGARLALVGIFAAFIAVHSLTDLVGTQISQVAGMAQDAETRAERWNAVTYSSQPKSELLSVAVPGLFGFRTDWYMYDSDQPKADKYWGQLPPPVGTGNYVGVGVVVIALWALVQSFRKQRSPFTLLQRRAIWFWSAMLLVAALLAFGRFAPFFQFFYALPYASTIRAPVKFMHIFSWILVILFGYGMHGLYVTYLREPVAQAGGLAARFKTWWKTGLPFDRKWLVCSAAFIIASLLGWLMYASSDSSLQTHLQGMGISPDLAPGIAKFSQQAVGWFVLFLVLTVGWLAFIFSGQFAGPRAKWGLVLFGTLLVVDLGRADRFWISYWDADYKYRPDPIVDFLADKPYEHRVVSLPVNHAFSPQHLMLINAYSSDWKQHLFWYDNIQCIDVAQEPRIGVDKTEFMTALPGTTLFNIFRYWQLSNTRYILWPTGEPLKQIDPGGNQFRVLKTFDFVPKRPDPSPYPVDYNTEIKPDGQLAVLEFLGALPRASLYSNWQVQTNDAESLQTLSSPAFDPHQKVLVADSLPAPAVADLNQAAGTVEINTNYAAKRVELAADVKVPSVLLLCDRYNQKWQVMVDDKPEKVLRCNFVERGVFLQPGKHKVVFEFVPSVKTFYVSLLAVLLGLGLWIWLALGPDDVEPTVSEPPPGQPNKN
jgi:hypothetical protein